MGTQFLLSCIKKTWLSQIDNTGWGDILGVANNLDNLLALGNIIVQPVGCMGYLVALKGRPCT